MPKPCDQCGADNPLAASYCRQCGRALTDASKRVYDPARLSSLLAPLPVARPEYAWSREGLWTPCTESEAATADWSGATRAVALIAVTMPRN